MSENNGVTKQDLLDMEMRLMERLTERITESVTDRVRESVGGRIDAFEERMKGYIAGARHDLGTRIVAEFYK